MPKTSVILQYRETGQTTPVELADGQVIGHTTRPPGRQFWQYEMTVERFNELAPKIFVGRFAPGHEPIPQIVVTATDEELAAAKAAQAAKQAEQERIAAEAEAAAQKEAAELEKLREEVEALEAAEVAAAKKPAAKQENPKAQK